MNLKYIYYPTVPSFFNLISYL